MNILITGGTGLIGTRLSQLLLQEGHQVAHLSRSEGQNSAIKTFVWDITKGQIDDQALLWADALVHLAGAGIADSRWTEARKQEIINSRTQSLDLIYRRLSQIPHHIKVLVSSSAIGYYGGDTGQQQMSESSAVGQDFMAKVCVAWEAATQPIEALGIRTVILRTGIVLSNLGGALPKLAMPIKLGAGSPLGSGQQWQSWIHLDDMARLFQKAITDTNMQGIYNGTAPQPVTNETLTYQTAKALNRPLFLPNVPVFALKLLLGEMAIVVVGGCYVKNERVAQTDFEYRYDDLAEALAIELA